jgi:tellurite resistance protein
VAINGEGRLGAVQYAPELESRNRIESDPDLMEKVEWARKVYGVATVRRHLLSDAVAINERILPDLYASIRDISERSRIDLPFETFVFSAPVVNAAVIPSGDRMIVAISSATIESLSREELDFVVGHELGHAAYGHLDLPAASLVDRGENLNPRHAMQLMAWQRRAEISADRAGLICCGSLNVAATSMFKTMSGLTLRDISVDPHEFANQWDDLSAELSRDVRHDHWMATHPFPPLRMHALLAFSRTTEAGLSEGGLSGSQEMSNVDSEIEHMLGMIDPLARDGDLSKGAGDPLLREFFLWGGLSVASADGSVDHSELANLATVVGQGPLSALEEEGFQGAEEYRRRFKEALQTRQTGLTALEIQRIFSALAAIAKADGRVEETEVEAMQELAKIVGISSGYVRTII